MQILLTMSNVQWHMSSLASYVLHMAWMTRQFPSTSMHPSPPLCRHPSPEAKQHPSLANVGYTYEATRRNFCLHCRQAYIAQLCWARRHTSWGKSMQMPHGATDTFCMGLVLENSITPTHQVHMVGLKCAAQASLQVFFSPHPSTHPCWVISGRGGGGGAIPSTKRGFNFWAKLLKIIVTTGGGGYVRPF